MKITLQEVQVVRDTLEYVEENIHVLDNEIYSKTLKDYCYGFLENKDVLKMELDFLEKYLKEEK